MLKQNRKLLNYVLTSLQNCWLNLSNAYGLLLRVSVAKRQLWLWISQRREFLRAIRKTLREIEHSVLETVTEDALRRDARSEKALSRLIWRHRLHYIFHNPVISSPFSLSSWKELRASKDFSAVHEFFSRRRLSYYRKIKCWANSTRLQLIIGDLSMQCSILLARLRACATRKETKFWKVKNEVNLLIKVKMWKVK